MLNLVLIGFGNVNRGLVGLLRNRRQELQQYGLEYRVTGVYSRRLGFLVNPDGFDLDSLLQDQAKPTTQVSSVPAWLEATRANVVFEASSLEPYTGQPAMEYIRVGLERGCHVITANKGPLVHGFAELNALARSQGVRFLFEATFMGGCPIYSMFRETLPTAKLNRFRGLPNSTSTVILEAIEQGSTYADGVKQAQDLGIAETDPSYDVDGWDAAVKMIGLANVLMGATLGIEDVEREGIGGLGEDTIREAHRANTPIRLVAQVWREGSSIRASVKPERLESSDPLRAAKGMDMLAYFETDVLPGLTVIAHDGDAITTAYDMLCDFVTATC
jgi:homoserine dehydrogenase